MSLLKQLLQLVMMFGLILMFCLPMSGCGEQKQKPSKAKVVHKKIKMPPKTVEAVKLASPKPVLETKPIIAKVAPEQPLRVEPEILVEKPDKSEEEVVVVKPEPEPAVPEIPVPETSPAPIKPLELKDQVIDTVDIPQEEQPDTDPIPFPEEEEPLQPPATEKTDQRTVALVAAVSQIGAYDSTGKIDPFMPLFSDKPPKKKPEEDMKNRIVAKIKRKKGPLELVDLSQLNLVAVIMAESGNRAMVEEASGKGYIVKKGTYMGIRNGKVTKILKNSLVVEEEETDWQENISIRERKITLRPVGEEYHDL